MGKDNDSSTKGTATQYVLMSTANVMSTTTQSRAYRPLIFIPYTIILEYDEENSNDKVTYWNISQ